MLKIIAIVSEYNPFHNGHLYQIQKIKEIFPDSVIISVMSGSLVQRGELALFSKYSRAEIAVKHGVDLVLELPSVYSNSPANIFAFSAVYIMQKLSGIDYICFGSESGDLELLDFAAEKIMSDDFGYSLVKKIKANPNQSYPKSVYNLFFELYGEEKAAVLNGSNNILALEYLKALKKLDSDIKPLTIKRTGADFNESASYIRKIIRDMQSLVGFAAPPFQKGAVMPETAYKIFCELINNGKYTDINNISSAIISHLNRIEVEEYRVKKSLDGCFDYDSLIKKLEAKHITSSSVRRMILNIFFGITKNMQNNPPDFTVVLGFNQKGKNYLNSIRKKTEIEIVTKPANIKNNIIFEKNLFIDNICKLALFNKNGEINSIKQKPFILI